MKLYKLILAIFRKNRYSNLKKYVKAVDSSDFAEISRKIDLNRQQYVKENKYKWNEERAKLDKEYKITRPSHKEVVFLWEERAKTSLLKIEKILQSDIEVSLKIQEIKNFVNSQEFEEWPVSIEVDRD